MAKTTSISCKGDRNFVKAVKAIAYGRGLDMGEFVYKALMAYAGDEIEEKHKSFFNQDGINKFQLEGNTEVVAL